MSGTCLLAPIPEGAADGLLGTDIKLAVLGSGRVGKSAMIVRFLTKRFIGDYEPNTGSLYSRLVHVEGDEVSIQIQDTPGCLQVKEDFVQVLDSFSRCVKWAEGFLLVYSITDYSSYQSIRPLYQHIRKVHPDSKIPIIIVGNKADLLHARQYLCKEVSKLHHTSSRDKRRSSIITRPKSPNMQDLKRRFKQALSSKVKVLPDALGQGSMAQMNRIGESWQPWQTPDSITICVLKNLLTSTSLLMSVYSVLIQPVKIIGMSNRLSKEKSV
ncbi:ras-like protein family member 11A [Alligator mississippiensis]|uniref:small monomeric GTPase n=1 Tax=Alligator mississippiensis TaxID=8496 RepID=A0A151MSC3_ALLMI|nr:ras-like protein family member 11A [Alligator mississippiensis]